VKLLPFVTPPDQVYELAPLAVNVTALPKQMLDVAVLAMDNAGSPLLTVTLILREVVQLEAVNADKVYTILAEGVTTMEDVLAPVLQE
jgi:hypothetical protein